MELYFFDCGILKCDKSLITAGRDIGVPFEIPVPYFLITHPKGNVLFDTGNAREVSLEKDFNKHWGAIAKIYEPVMHEETYVVENLRSKVGIKPEDISLVILSHLHLDHAGGVGEFPNAEYIVQHEELRWASVPDFYQKLAYIRADFVKPDLNWRLLEGHDDDNYDVFGDGKLIIWFTPGHTPGHQSLVVKLENSGPMILTGDSCYTTEILNEDVLPGLGWNSELAARSVKRFRDAQNRWGWKVVTGHDPDSWPKWKKAPEYYD